MNATHSVTYSSEKSKIDEKSKSAQIYFHATRRKRNQ